MFKYPIRNIKTREKYVIKMSAKNAMNGNTDGSLHGVKGKKFTKYPENVLKAYFYEKYKY